MSELRSKALKVLYDMAAQTLDRGTVEYDEWPEAYEALMVIMPEVYPDGDDSITTMIEAAESAGERMPDCLLEEDV